MQEKKGEGSRTENESLSSYQLLKAGEECESIATSSNDEFAHDITKLRVVVSAEVCGSAVVFFLIVHGCV